MSTASAPLRDALYSPIAWRHFRLAAEKTLVGVPRGLHMPNGQLWLHALAPLALIKGYANAFALSKVKLVTGSEPLAFHDSSEVEVAAVTWKEVQEFEDDDSQAFVVEFAWQPQILQAFFENPNPGIATISAPVTLCFQDPNGGVKHDYPKFVLKLVPEFRQPESTMDFFSLAVQMEIKQQEVVLYQTSFRSIDPTFQMHIGGKATTTLMGLSDLRKEIFKSKETYHEWHALMVSLKARQRLRFLIRMKPPEKGGLADCGCC